MLGEYRATRRSEPGWFEMLGGLNFHVCMSIDGKKRIDLVATLSPCCTWRRLTCECLLRSKRVQTHGLARISRLASGIGSSCNVVILTLAGVPSAVKGRIVIVCAPPPRLIAPMSAIARVERTPELTAVGTPLHFALTCIGSGPIKLLALGVTV